MTDSIDRAIASVIRRGPPPGRIDPDAHVWHFVLRNAAKPLRPDRLATVVLSRAEFASLGRRRVLAALEASRNQWAKIAAAAGYAEGFTVELVHERGFVRSIFPGAAIAGAPGGPTA